METVRAWAAGLCASAAAGAVVTILAPSGSIEKSVKTVVSVFLLCAIILPFFSGGFSIDDFSLSESEEYASTQNSLYDEVSRQTENMIKSSVERILQSGGITYGEVLVNMENKDGGLTVDSITVINPDADSETVAALIRNELGAEVRVERRDE